MHHITIQLRACVIYNQANLVADLFVFSHSGTGVWCLALGHFSSRTSTVLYHQPDSCTVQQRGLNKLKLTGATPSV